jgi:hypothetical protein
MRETSGTAVPRHDSISASKELVRVSGQARQLERRLFLKQGLSLGALTLLTGCDVTDTACSACSTAYRNGTIEPRPRSSIRGG